MAFIRNRTWFLARAIFVVVVVVVVTIGSYYWPIQVDAFAVRLNLLRCRLWKEQQLRRINKMTTPHGKVEDDESNQREKAKPYKTVEIPLQERHQAKSVSIASFVGTAVLLPIVSVTVLPLSLAYQTGKYLMGGGHATSSTSSREGQEVIEVEESQRIPRPERKYDMVVLGATGFTGGLAVRYLAQKTLGVNPGGGGGSSSSSGKVKWAIAGRSKPKLEQVKSQLAQELNDPSLLTLDTIVVDTFQPGTLPDLVRDTRVVATTAGPYSLYGSAVVEACAKYGTHYVDITGEVDWVRSMIAHWQSTAQQTGACIVPFCGQDSIPWDLLVLKLQQALQTDCQDELVSVTFWDQFRGSPPGGTIATVNAAVEGTATVASKYEFDPLLRLPNGEKSAFRVKNHSPSFFIQPSQSPWDVGVVTRQSVASAAASASSSGLRRWTMPFVMAGINARVVQWSHALRQSGSPTLVYSECQVVPNFRTAFCYFFSQVMLGAALFNPWTNRLLRNYVLPKSGQGPSLHAMEHHHYLYILAQGMGRAGHRAQACLYFSKNVGCLETARMLIEAGLLLAQKETTLPGLGGGFWSPSTAFGDVLLDRVVNEDTKYACQSFPKEQVLQAKLSKAKL